MIWPEFMDDKDQVITKCDVPVPLSGTAKMWIINDDFRRYHKDKIQVGLKGNAHEGETVVANYVVTKIVELMNVE